MYDEEKKTQIDFIKTKDVYNYSKNTINPDWCERCALFADGLCNSPLVLDKLHVYHAYIYMNDIWKSNWHFYNLYSGHRDTDFCKRFCNRDYYEIQSDDIAYIKNKIEKLGAPDNVVDRDALNETTWFIQFCERWLNKPNMLVIYRYEI
jgi:hypothetical protein